MAIFPFFRRKLPIDTAQIEQLIAELEQQTSAEIRVVVERRAKQPNALVRAEQLFDELAMHQTAERNGVLLYLAFKPHLVAVVGDVGIHQKVGDAFWQAVYQAMKNACQQGEFTQAICDGIRQVAAELACHFPIQPNDRNELPNQVVIK